MEDTNATSLRVLWTVVGLLLIRPYWDHPRMAPGEASKGGHARSGTVRHGPASVNAQWSMSVAF